jgi:Protein of unknown function (DUF1549)/Protein of unknown function (DUF1553)/Planctomycete cytochrome C
MLRGGDDGPALIPGNPDASLLIKAIRYTDKDLQMPPSGKLSDSIIKDFESWVKMGAPDPRDGASALANKNYDTEQAKKWWSFQPLHRPAPAKVTDSAWPKGDIDKFVLASLESKQIKPNPDADKTALIRRVSFDLIGLPPTPDEIDAFLNDSTADAYAKLVDRLLASPQFGERWGRHWLDVARYAESTGKDSNMTYPNAWRYRDYVIAAFNADKPYDQFIKEQLAGDLFPGANPKKKAEQEIATGFLALGPKSLTEQVSRQFALDQATEQVDATTTCFMALTVSCARCHDHKFDPILQKDFYSMAGIFLSTKTKYGTLAGPRNLEPTDLIEISSSAPQPTVQENLTPKARDQLQKDLASATADYDELLAGRGRGGAGVGNQIQQALGLKSHLEAQLASYDSAGHPKAFCMGVEDRPPSVGRTLAMGPMVTRRGALARVQTGFETIADSPLFFRGEASEPRDRVPRGVPTFLAWSGMASIPPSESGRKELANWISSPKNPLTARVMANRLWHWLMGQGIVASVDNFGTMGEAPSDQALLDFLANRLIDNNWSLKKTIREIVMSRTYQLSSTYTDESYQADPQNALCWRHNPVRLDAESLRDAMLSVSGQLDLKPPMGSMVAYAGDGAVSAGPNYMRINEMPFINAAGFNRSIYLPVIREVEPDAMGLFDFPDTNLVIGDRESTNVPSQALYLINNDYVHMQARRMGQRIMAAYPGRIGQPRIQAARIDYAFRLAFGRNATPSEQKTATDFFASIGGPDGVLPAEAWGDFCLALFNTAEFRYLK